MNNTKIEWTEKSWNPVTGCKHGCEYCYAAAISRRFGRSFEPRFHESRLTQPAREKNPKMIFVCSMADLFGEWVPRRWIESVIDIARAVPRHTFQFLTKNPSRLHEFDWPQNAWVGATATNRKQARNAVSALARVDAPVRFISAEPLLERIDLNGGEYLDWLIIGACTGAARSQPAAEWVESLVRFAKKNDIPLFTKPNLEFRAAWKEMPRPVNASQVCLLPA